MNVEIRVAEEGDEQPFLDAVRRSVALHTPWVSPPDTPKAYRDYLARFSTDRCYTYLAWRRDRGVLPGGDLVGCINVTEIVRGSFQSGYLGYYAFAPLHGAGLMKQAMALVVSAAFGELGLHRLEANIQPTNDRSIGLVKSLGFRLEGHSPRYLRIGGAWRDHDRYAITAEEWKG